MYLQDIYIYPIKSLGGVRLDEARPEDRGFELDRRWMLTDKNGRFLTQREFPEMALFQVVPEKDGLRVFHRESPENAVYVPLQPLTDIFFPVTIWEDEVEAQLVDTGLSAWFSRQLGTDCDLVFMPHHTKRKLKPKYAVNDDEVSFADGMPYLLIGQASLDDLNGRLGTPVPMDRFRPNLVISGSAPFEEDTWKDLRIGDARFRIIKPCARCVVVTTDQQSGERNKEPLKTLSGYRKTDGKVMFGQNMVLLEGGPIRTGDPVTAETENSIAKP